MRYWVAAAAFLLLTAQTSVPRLGETIEVSIVNLDVIVTDKAGNRVHGLQPSDFEVRESGKLQKITNFSEFRSENGASSGTYAVGAGSPAPSSSSEPPTKSAGEDTGAPRNARTITVFVERCRLQKWDADRMFGAIKEALHRVVRKGDAASIIFWEGTQETVKQDFTDDLAKLDQALDDLALINTKLTLVEADSVRNRQAQQDRIDAMLEGTGTVDNTMEIESEMLAERALMQMRAKVYALRSLVRIMAPSEGRKVLLMATRRFSEYPGSEFFPGGEIPPKYKDRYNTRQLRKTFEDSANSAGVTVYAVYPIGLDNTSMVSAEEGPSIRLMTSERDIQRTSFDFNVALNEHVSLDEVAHATGGLMASSAVDIAAMMPKVAEDMENYYSIGYRGAPGKNKTRNVTITTVNRAYRVRARTSYVEKNDNERMSERIIAQLFRAESANALGITAQLGQMTKDGRKFSVPLKVRIPIGKLTALPDGRQHSGAFTVFTATGGRIGVVSDVSQKTQEFRIPDTDLQRALNSYYTYTLTVVTDGAAEHISVGVLDEVSKQWGVVRVPLVQQARLNH